MNLFIFMTWGKSSWDLHSMWTGSRPGNLRLCRNSQSLEPLWRDVSRDARAVAGIVGDAGGLLEKQVFLKGTLLLSKHSLSILSIFK